jgi:hypothetical protein
MGVHAAAAKLGWSRAVTVFIGGEALASGRLTRYELTADHRRVLPRVYAPKRVQLSLDDRIAAAWLWSDRRGVLTGMAASALHGAEWVDANVPIEMNLAHNKSPAGVITRRDTLLDTEIMGLRLMAVTTVARTAFDLARRGSLGRAVENLDSLARATHFKPDDVLAVTENHPRVRGRRRIPHVLDLIDEGAQSPKETWLRLLLIAAGFPRPQTQIPIPGPDGYPRYYLDMGWPDLMVAVEYDGQQHRTDPHRFRADVTRSEYIDGRGWRRIRVLAGDHRQDIVRRVEQAGVPRSAGRGILQQSTRTSSV